MLYVDGNIIRPDASCLIGAAPAYWFLIQLFLLVACFTQHFRDARTGSCYVLRLRTIPDFRIMCL